MTVDHATPGATDTFNDAPSYVPAHDPRAAHAASPQRDQLAAENDRLRRQLETLTRAQRQLEEGLGEDRTGGRRIALLREALVRKDNEILTLKTQHLARERATQEARETAERMRRERAELEDRLHSREGVFEAIERERASLSQALEAARWERAQAASVLQQADGNVGEWRRAYEELSQRHDRLQHEVQQLTQRVADYDAWAATLRAELETAHADRSAMIHAHAREMAALSEQLQQEIEREREAAAERFEAAREAHAIQRRVGEDELTDQIESERREHAASMEAIVTGNAAAIEALRSRLDAEITAQRAQLATQEAAHALELDALRAEQSFALETVRNTAELVLEDATRPLRDDLATAVDRIRELEASLEAAHEALGTYATDTVERMQRAEEAAAEAEAAAADARMCRDRYAHKLAAAMEQLRVEREKSDAACRAQADSLRTVGTLLGALTTRTVLRGASERAVRAGRDVLSGSDVDGAIAEIARSLPPDVADELRAPRDVFVSPRLAE